VDELVASLKAAEREIAEKRNAVLELQTQLATRRRAAGAAVERVLAARLKLTANLLVRQEVPLWRASLTAQAFQSEIEEVDAGLKELWEEVVVHVGRRPGRVIAHGFVAMLLGWCFVRARAVVRRRARAAAESASAEGAPAEELPWPWAAGLLVALLLTPFFQPERPAGVQAIIVPTSLVVWFPVLGAMLPPVLRRTLPSLAVLVMIDIARLALSGFDLLAQTLLVVETVLGLVGVLWLRRPARLAQVPALLGRSFWFRFLDLWLRLVLLLLFVGLPAAVLGFVNLADRVVTLAIYGSYLGSVLFATVRVLEVVSTAVVDSGRLGALRGLRSQRARVRSAARRGLRAFGMLLWIYLMLVSGQLWDPFYSAAAGWLSADVGYGSFTISLGGVIAFGLTLWISWLLARFVAFTLEEEVFSRARMPPGVPYAITNFSRYTILVVGFLAALAVLGFSFDRVSLILGALGVGIGFGLQNVVNNFVSGAILLFERPLRVGDRIQLDNVLGLITHIGIRASHVRTFDGADVIVPNGDLLAARVVNWTLSDQKRSVIVPVGVAYGTPPRRVLEILESLARDHPEVLAEPAPEALFMGFGDSSLNFELRAFTDSLRGWMPVTSDIAVAVCEAIEAAGITIPFPQRDLHLRNAREVAETVASTLRSDGGAGRSGTREREGS
jgi:small-conductance mechanosensitive channel